MNEIRFALRSIARTPVFTTIVVLTLAVGIAGTTAVAGVAKAMLFRTLPYPDSHELFLIGRGPEAVNTSVTMTTFFLLRDRLSACEHIGVITGRPGTNMMAGGSAEYVGNAQVTAGFFEARGVAPLYGRLFRLEDEQAGRPRIALVDERLASRTFGSAQKALGETLVLGSQPHEIVGVLPGLERAVNRAEVWLPLQIQRGTNTGLNFTINCRLRDDRTFESAAAELASLHPEYAALHAETMKGTAGQGLALAPLQEVQSRELRPIVALLAVAVGVVLFIACTNSAWLFSARAVDRRSESAVRVALGAGRWRIVRQVLVESVLLALAGGGVGVVLAIWTTPWLLSLTEAGTWQADIGRVVIGVVALVTISTGALCGVIPALRHARLDPIEALQSGSRRLASGRDASGLLRAMVFAEVGLCMALLVTSGLLVRSIGKLHEVELGFDPARVVTAQVSMDDERYRSRAAVNALYDRVLEKLSADPDVESAAVITNIPIDRGLNVPIRPPVAIEGQPIVSVDWRYVSESYFETMRVPVRAGRLFTQADSTASTPVAIVNEAFVKRYFPEGRAVGLTVELVKMGPVVSDARQIVGVVANTQQQGLKLAPPATIYAPVRQVPDAMFGMVHGFFPVSWVVKSRGADRRMPELLASALREADPRLPISRTRTMDEVVDAAMSETRLQAVLISVFGFVSILMAVTALAASIVYSVMRRRRDIGVRLALGASVSEMLRAVVGENIALTVGGILVGSGLALLFRQALTPFLFGVTATDSLSYVAAGLLLLFVAGVTSFVSAASMLRIDPAETLRAE